MTTKVYEAIAGVMADLAKVGISKDSTNTQQNFKFRGIDAVFNALAPRLAAHKLCVLPRVLGREVTEKQTRSGGALFYTVLDVEFDFVSAEDGSKHTVRTIGEAMDSGDKSTNKAMSAAYKYACIQAFCIPTEGDNDADGTTHEVVPHADIEVAKIFDQHGQAIEGAADMVNLQKVWQTASRWAKPYPDYLASLTNIKEQRKAELGAAA